MDEIDYKLRSQNPTLISHVRMAKITIITHLHLCYMNIQLSFLRQYPS